MTNIEFNPPRDTFMSCSLDKTMKIWDVRTNKCSYELSVDSVPVGAHDPEGVVIAVGLESKFIKLYDIRNFTGVCSIKYLFNLIVILIIFRGHSKHLKSKRWMDQIGRK